GHLQVDAAHQWIATTTGRLALDPYSWMQAVHWIDEQATRGAYTPSRSHGPKWGPTTVAIAKLISALTECRPGIDWIARKLGASERTVQYHLDMLRETGLLAYRSKGTRLSGRVRQASHFERIIPTAFDTTLGIQTTGASIERRPVRIAEQSRKLIAKLAKKATRKTRRRRTKGPVSRGSRCTPMQGGTSTVPTAGTTSLPPESKLASGQTVSPTPKSSSKSTRVLNKVGRRHQLARQLTAQVPWLQHASVPRIAWIVRHVADAGWTATEVQAIAEQDHPLTAADVRRASGMLSHRLKGVHQLYPQPAQRARLVDHWRDQQTATRARHDGYEHGLTGAPERMSVRRILAGAVQRMNELAAATTVVDSVITADDTPALDDLDPATVIDLRAAAERDPAVIHACIDTAGESYARRLYTNRLVDQVLAADRSSNLRLHTYA
ncbi:helix-turn-helix domain-containing protein, partial [Streptomyces sp. t39]|uniref:helix-turn-helix domain-containing protein n=1 Tax=Streptomyces sp. t39 TaxID=1828156 RepID=UPI00164F2E43